MSRPVVRARDLGYRYPDGTHALRQLAFRIGPRDRVALVGPNGSGKSTLLLLLAGCMAPTEGELRIGETTVSRRTLEALRRAVGLVFQDPDDQLFMPTVADDVAFGPRNAGMSPSDAADRARHALEQVGAAHLGDRPPSRLSGGEKRAVALATVLAMTPEILALDEPSTGLDPRGRRRLIERLAASTEALVIASHDLDLVARLCDRALVLLEGRLVADCSLDELFGDAALLDRIGMEAPASRRACPHCGQLPP